MTRLVLVSLGAVLCLATIPGTAASQQLVAARETSSLFAVTPDDLPALRPSLEQAPSQAPQVRAVRRRRGSMVGYIEDSTVESRLRVRFDAATGTTAPDRAEFFYAKCGCYRDLPHDLPVYDPNAPGPRPGAADDLKFQQLWLEGEWAAGRVSGFARLPVRWLQPQSFIPGTGSGFGNQSGLSDLKLGAKVELTDSDATTVTAQVQFEFPTGDSEKGLGTNHTSIEPALLYRQDAGAIVAIESEVGIWLPVGGSAPVPTNADGHFAGSVFFYGIGPSFTVYRTDRMRFAPVIELVGWHVQGGNQTAAESDASGINIVNLKFGGRLSFDSGSLYFGYGHALTDAVWYDNIVRLEYRYSF